jgi:hypothetical protein
MAPRSSRPKHPAPAPAPAAAEEEIDINNVSEGSSEDEGTPNPAPTKGQASGANAPGDLTTRVNPIIRPVVKSNRALDVDLLFQREKGKQSVCKVCK